MMQSGLFDRREPEAFARRADPPTSLAAAASVSVADLEQVVLDALRKYGCGTTEQLSGWTGLSLVTVSPRMRPLERKGLVTRGNKKPNRSGRLATVWTLT